ncbi:uncharacterized protein LOC111904753 [Lactuca sativa]|uniref:uncharacterized protein LOC111904753 n=1 Tax=Lactuca sativa TaxID=4236 RepID=UPI000CD83AD8|nr:uncharacterized protein LOC111904753 [Lactuca sativa]
MDSYAKRRLELNDYAGIPSNKSFHSLLVEAKGYDNLPFSEIDCRSYIAKVRQLRLGQGDAEALRNYFVRMQKRSSNFFYVIDMDDEGHMQNFAPFVGVNHHGQSILFGCGLLSREDTKTYVWLFKSWYDAIAFDVQCSCHSFEFHGIIFRHMVKILIEKDVKEIHPRFILSQWRKDVNHGHHSVINCYEDLMSGENAKQSDYLCCNFYEVAHIANSHEKYEYLVNCINMAKEKLNDDSFWGCSSNVNWIVEDVCVPDSTKKLLPPLQVRSKGHPPSKRKESRAERVMKKNRKKNVLEKTDNIQKDPMGPSREHGEISYKDEPNYQFDLNAPV